MTSRHRMELMQWLSGLVQDVNKSHPELQVEMPKEDEWVEIAQHFFVSPILQIQGIEIVVDWKRLDTARRFTWVDHALNRQTPSHVILDRLLTDEETMVRTFLFGELIE